MEDVSTNSFNDGQSSPFMSEADPRSRMASKQWEAATKMDAPDDHTMDVFKTPYKYPMDMTTEMEQDKENVSQYSVSKRSHLATDNPNPASKSSHTEFAKDPLDAGAMLPPSRGRPTATPRRSPLKSARIIGNTPASTRRTPSATFQPGFNPAEGDPSAQDQTNEDDTCFSAFSEVPEMTLYAKLGRSPTKRGDMLHSPAKGEEATPRVSRKRPSPSRSPSPTPRRLKTPASVQEGNTTFLIDFTQQLEGMAGYTQTTVNKSTTEPDLLRYMNHQRSPAKAARTSYGTPGKSRNLLNLLDFELPPAPTPRSVPTITVRELESLKSSYLSQISSLKATLSGREAEVESLKRAIVDAERRVGDAQETLREEKSRREHVEEEKSGWEKRGQELENVLKNVKEEVLKSEAEKEDLIRKLEDCDRRVEDAEARAVKAEERFADALAARASLAEGESNGTEEQVQKLVAAQIDAKIEAVSRELHAVYKEKHERKVATLKKSYEARNEKKCADLQTRLTKLEKENEELMAAKDATFSGPVPESVNNDAELKAQLEEHKATVARLENERETSQKQQAQLMQELRQERIEKGDLVAAVDEMLALQAEQGPTQEAMSVVEDFRKSISRPTGIRTAGGIPAPSESKIGKGGPGSLGRSFLGGKSRMLANIERMGRTASGTGNAANE